MGWRTIRVDELSSLEHNVGEGYYIDLHPLGDDPEDDDRWADGPHEFIWLAENQRAANSIYSATQMLMKTFGFDQVEHGDVEAAQQWMNDFIPIVDQEAFAQTEQLTPLQLFVHRLTTAIGYFVDVAYLGRILPQLHRRLQEDPITMDNIEERLDSATLGDALEIVKAYEAHSDPELFLLADRPPWPPAPDEPAWYKKRFAWRGAQRTRIRDIDNYR